MVDKNKKTWPEKLPEALWAYKTTVRIAIQATPYSLVFRGSRPTARNTAPIFKTGHPQADHYQGKS